MVNMIICLNYVKRLYIYDYTVIWKLLSKFLKQSVMKQALLSSIVVLYLKLSLKLSGCLSVSN